MKRIFTLFLALATVFAVTKAADVVFNVVVPFDNTKPTTHMTYEVWIVGSFNGWNNNQKKLTKVDDTHYTITMDDATWASGVTKENVQYKYLSGGGSWDYVEKLSDGEEKHANRVYVGTNTWTEGDKSETSIGTNGFDTVPRWAFAYNPTSVPIVADIVVEAYVAKNITELYITGSFNGWKSPGSAGTQMNYIAADSDAEGNFFRDTIHTEDANTLAYKFAAGPSWVYEQTAGDLKLSDPNAKSVWHENMTFKRIYPGAANLKTVTFNVVAPAGTQHLYMMGSHLGWDGASWAGTRIADGKFVFTVPNVDLMDYKYYAARDWGTEEKKADLTGVSDRRADAQIAITFNDTVKAWNTSVTGTASPVAELTFNDGFGSATVVGTPTTATGKEGNAYKGAAASYITLPVTASKSMSVEFFYKVNATPDRAGIIGLGNPDSISGNHHLVQGMQIFRENSGGKQRIKTVVGSANALVWNDGVDILADADWVHVVVAVGNGESKVYVDGQLASNGNVAAIGATAMTDTMDVTNCTKLDIGISTNLEAQGWNHHADESMIDNLKVYDVALSDIQVMKAKWIATEVRNAKANNEKAFYVNGALNIPQYNGKVALFDVTGKLIVSNVVENGILNINLTQGAYILKTDNANFKLMVK